MSELLWLLFFVFFIIWIISLLIMSILDIIGLSDLFWDEGDGRYIESSGFTRLGAIIIFVPSFLMILFLSLVVIFNG